MGSHPLNLALRFLLEISILVASGMWGWHQSDQWYRYIIAFGIPLVLALIWAIFAVPDDPSRSGKAPVPVPGIVRLIIELGIFTLAIWALYDLRNFNMSIIFGVITIIHYFISYDRIKWLLHR